MSKKVNNITFQLPDQPVCITLCGDALKVVASEQTPELEWSQTLLEGDAVEYQKAVKAVKKLGKGWRLPTRDELASLVDASRHDPAIDLAKFPDTKSNYYWTSTPCSWDIASVWVVGFGGGYVGDYRRSYVGCVRAVRSGQ